MLKTNSKAAQENIEKYIDIVMREDIEDSYIDGGLYETRAGDCVIYDPHDIDFLCWVIWDIFETEKHYNDEYMNAGRISVFDVFKMWAQGLALGQSFIYHYRQVARDIVADILEETDNEKNRYTEQQAEQLLDKLLFDRIKKGAAAYC